MEREKRNKNASQSVFRTDTQPSKQGDVAAFLQKTQQISAFKKIESALCEAPRGRLIFSLDATMSRQHTWDLACKLQAEMFHAVQSVGTLDVQLTYFRGFQECRSSKWVSDATSLYQFMSRIRCAGGMTQLKKVLRHGLRENKHQSISAIVFIGDAMEENLDIVCDNAGKLGLNGIPIFVFQEGCDAQTKRAFEEIARLSRGVYARFDAGSADHLSKLLRAVAVYAAGGLPALKSNKDNYLLPQLMRHN